MRKREGITVLKRISVVLCRFKHRFGSDLLLLVVLYSKNCFRNTTYHNAKEIIDNMSTKGQPDGHRQFSFTFVLILPISYAMLWTPNAYRDIQMRIFTPCLFFQCVFTNFQCVITLLRALSVALLT